jgi:type I restriction enzyme S subunit
MNRIDELIKKLCPNGVEYKKASEIKIESFWLMPSTPTYIADGVPYITSKNIKNGKINFENVNYISEKDYLSISSNRTIKKNDLLITMIGTIGETAFVEEDIKFYGQNMYLIRLNEKVINRKFFNYYLTSEKIKNSLVSRKNTSSQGYIKAGSIENLLLPVPPLEIQCEIVHILDDFTLLSAELSAELKARQKQYQYYIDYFYALENKENLDGKIYQLDELGELIRGKRFVHADAVSENGIPAIHYGELYTYYGVIATETKSQIRKDIPKKLRYAKKGDIVIVGAGENNIDIGVGVAWLGDYEVAVHDACYIFHPSEKVLSKYISFYLRADMYHQQIKKYVSEGKICAISAQGIGKSKIYVPSIEEQKRVIKILENFDKLNKDIRSGIPAEIEARQKQYEYYRDKLLTFKELKVNE